MTGSAKGSDDVLRDVVCMKIISLAVPEDKMPIGVPT